MNSSRDELLLGRTVPSYRNALEIELNRWRDFEKALRKFDREVLREMLDSCRCLCSAASNAVRNSLCEGVLMTLLLNHQKALGYANAPQTVERRREKSLEREIASWRGFREALRIEDRRLFEELMNLARRHAPAVKASSRPVTSEALFMAILLEHHKQLRRLGLDTGKTI